MKNTYSILERNRIVEEHLWCIDSVMRKNHALIRTAHLDYEEVYQQLALRLIRAVETFDPDKGVLRVHILAQLKNELLSCKTPRRLYGISIPLVDRKIHCGFVVLPIFFCCHLWYSISRVNTTCANTVGGKSNGTGLYGNK